PQPVSKVRLTHLTLRYDGVTLRPILTGKGAQPASGAPDAPSGPAEKGVCHAPGDTPHGGDPANSCRGPGRLFGPGRPDRAGRLCLRSRTPRRTVLLRAAVTGFYRHMPVRSSNVRSR